VRVNKTRQFIELLRGSVNWRQVIAYILMAAFIVCTTVGAALMLPAAGWITAGVTCAVVGYLLGAD
jgi:hypothetical protein